MDATQQSVERKERYKLILDFLQNLKNENLTENISVEHVQDLQEKLRNNDEIHREGTSAIESLLNSNTELLMDVQVLKSAHEIVSKIFMCNSEFNDQMYANALKSLVYQGDTMNWDIIAEMAAKVSCATYTKSSMLGAVHIELEERPIKERQKCYKSKTKEEQHPEIIQKVNRRDRGAEKLNIIIKQLNAIFKANNNEPIPYYKLIIDPNNFMNTLENAFQLSFLARDGNIAIETGRDLYPQVRCIRPDELPATTATSQSICSLNMKYCQELVDFYDIKKPMIQVPDDSSESELDNDDK